MTDLPQRSHYGAQTGDDVNAREAYRGHPWFGATVEFCERLGHADHDGLQHASWVSFVDWPFALR